MISRNGVRVDSQQLRDIQDLISKLDDVNKQLAQPIHAVPLGRVVKAADASALEPTVPQAPVLPVQAADAASAQRVGR